MEILVKDYKIEIFDSIYMEVSMEKVKIGFLGCGFMGQLAHLKNYIDLDTCEVVAICDKKAKQVEMVAARYGIPKIYHDYREMLADPEIEAIVAAQHFSNYVNIVPEILKAKKHLLTEKPLCIHPENGKKLAEYAQKQGLIHMVAYHKRSDPASEYAVDVINKWKSSGEMGKMKYVRITMPPGDWIGGAKGCILTDEQMESIEAEPRMPGIDEKTQEKMIWFVNYYIHQVNYMRNLFGEDYKLTFADKSGVVFAVESDSGVCGIIEMQPYETTDSWQERAFVAFEKGWIDIQLPAPLASQQAGKVTVFTNDQQTGVYTSPCLPNVSAMQNQAANFVAAVRGVKKAPCISSEAVKDLQIALEYIHWE